MRLIMQKKIIILITAMTLAFVLCGSASAAIVKADHLNNTKINMVGSTVDQFEPVIDGNRISWVQADSSGHTSIYVKNMATGYIGKVQASSQDQRNPDISGCLTEHEPSQK